MAYSNQKKTSTIINSVFLTVIAGIIKPVYNDHTRKTQKVFVGFGWSLYTGETRFKVYWDIYIVVVVHR